MTCHDMSGHVMTSYDMSRGDVFGSRGPRTCHALALVRRNPSRPEHQRVEARISGRIYRGFIIVLVVGSALVGRVLIGSRGDVACDDQAPILAILWGFREALGTTARDTLRDRINLHVVDIISVVSKGCAPAAAQSDERGKKGAKMHIKQRQKQQQQWARWRGRVGRVVRGRSQRLRDYRVLPTASVHHATFVCFQGQ